MKNVNQLVIIGGGASISEGIEKGLWKKLEGRFSIGCNYSFNFLESTILCYVDDDFYKKQAPNMAHMPLIVGKELQFKHILPNTIMLRTNSRYKRDLSDGVYKSSLCGLFALSLGIKLLNIGKIFLLGFDMGELRKKDFEKFAKSSVELNNIMFRDKKGRAYTHFYQSDESLNHRGIGKISYYNSKNRAQENFGVYENEKKIKIYNVSLISKIPDIIFEKISYEEFFKKLDKNKYDQEMLKNQVKRILSPYKK